MYYKATSSKSLIAKVFRDFGITHSGWVYDAYEWIGDALEIIGHSVGYIHQAIPHDIKEFKARLRCNVATITGIQYNGMVLRSNDAINSLREGNKGYTGNWYTLNPNAIHTSFECGTVTIYANTIAVDDEGYPLVPDAPLHREAIKWYILTNLLAKGYKHPVFNYKDAEQRWLSYYPQAQNEGSFPDAEQYDSFRRDWTRIFPVNDSYDSFFNNDVIVGTSAYEIRPKDNGATIIHVEA